MDRLLGQELKYLDFAHHDQEADFRKPYLLFYKSVIYPIGSRTNGKGCQ